MAFKTVDNLSLLLQQAAAKDADIDFNSFARNMFAYLQQSQKDSFEYQRINEETRKADERYDFARQIQEEKIDLEEDTLKLNTVATIKKNSIVDVDIPWDSIVMNTDIGNDLKNTYQETHNQEMNFKGKVNDLFSQYDAAEDVEDKLIIANDIQTQLTQAKSDSGFYKIAENKFKLNATTLNDERGKNFLMENVATLSSALDMDENTATRLINQIYQAPNREAAERIYNDIVKASGKRAETQVQLDVAAMKDLMPLIKGLEDIQDAMIVDPKTGKPLTNDIVNFISGLISKTVTGQSPSAVFDKEAVAHTAGLYDFIHRGKAVDFKDGRKALAYQDNQDGLFYLVNIRNDGTFDFTSRQQIENRDSYDKLFGDEFNLGSTSVTQRKY